MNGRSRRVALVARPTGDAVPELDRFRGIIEALAPRGIMVQVIPFTEEAAEAISGDLLQFDGVLVWVDPISDGRNRSVLDALLRDVASHGIWVTTHPDVILKMGTKDVLVKTSEMAWGTDCFLYSTPEEMKDQLPGRLSSGPRVLKQHRGNGGNGVWKVELAGKPSKVEQDSAVHVLHARRGSSIEDMSLADFLDRCRDYFAGSGCMIDQPYQSRLADGMVRCYLVKDRVAGFGHQFVTALLPPPEGSTQSPLPPPRLYYGPERPEFQALKARLESGWVDEMQRLLDIDDDALPLLWDADFLYGPKDKAGEDTYALCEINVSSVAPFPADVLEPLADAVLKRLSRQLL